MIKIFKFIRKLCLFLLLSSMLACYSVNKASPLEFPSQAINDAIQESVSNQIVNPNDTLPNKWWTLFNDDQLSGFIQQAIIANPTLQSARTNIVLAAYNADRLKSTLYPQVSYGADVLREKLSETGLIPFNQSGATGPAPPLTTPFTPGNNGIPVYFTQYETELTLFYDFDLWGKNRNTWSAAIGQMRAAAADEAFIRLQVAVSIAQVYYQLQIDYKRLKVAQDIYNVQREYVETLQSRVVGNIDNIIPFKNSQNALKTAKTNLLQIQQDISVNEYRLKSYLAGDFLEKIDEIKISECNLPKVPMPDDLPLHLISQRPDITAQLWLIESAGKQIEVAKAGFYPDFSITGLFGFQTIHWHKLFQWPSTFWNLDPAITLPIFDGGLLQANLKGSEVNYNLAILEYNRLIINAVQDVLSSLSVLRNTSEQLVEYQKMHTAQQEILQLTQLRVLHNLNSKLDLLVSEQNLLNVQDQELIAVGHKIQAILMLIKALGGGYNACNMEG